MIQNKCIVFGLSIALLSLFGLARTSYAWTPKTRGPICNYMSRNLAESEIEACSMSSAEHMLLNSREGKEVRFELTSSGSISIWYPYQRGDKSVCEPNNDTRPNGKYQACNVLVKHNNEPYAPGEVHESICTMDGPPRRCFSVSLTSGAAILSWSVKKDIVPVENPSIASVSRPFNMNTPVTLPNLGPIFNAYGLGAGFKTVPKIHRPILSTMVGGRNILGHGIVQFNVLSHERGASYGYNFRISVNCTLRKWDYLESHVSLMGGAQEGFGRVNGAKMGPWACNRFGFKY